MSGLTDSVTDPLLSLMHKHTYAGAHKVTGVKAQNIHSELWVVWKFFTIMCYQEVAVGEKRDLVCLRVPVCLCVFVLSGHTHVALITFHSWLHVSRQEGN